MGKPQAVVEDPKKPAAGFAENKARFANPEDIAEIQEQTRDIERQRLRTQARATKVSTFLGDSFFRVDKTWPFLYHPTRKMQLSVRYYFPKKNLAIDQFQRPTKDDFAEVEFKKKALKAAGVKYFPMFPEHKLLDLADYL